MEKLYISENGRYFVKADGTRFNFLADTAWTVPARLKWDDAEYYMKTRLAQGFTVLQMVVLDPEYNPDMRDPSGNKALIDGDVLKPNEQYFRYVDKILDMAEEYGFYVLLLPAWGQLVVGDNWSGGIFEKTITEDNSYQYGEWLGARMKHRNNILWCLGGDRMPIHKGTDYRNVWRRMAEGLARGVLGKDLKYNEGHEEWEKLLITYHACHEMETGKCSTFSYWTDEEAWISFIMLQSGHGTKPKNYELVAEEYNRDKVPGQKRMPVWDGEPAYEMMPRKWPIEKVDDDSFHGTYIVRARAYWSLLAGSFGHTYGHSSVWCTISEKDRNFIAVYDWFEAIHSEGSKQIKILRDFMEAFPLQEFVPCNEVLLEQAGGRDSLETHEQASFHEGLDLMLVYFPGGADETLDLGRMKNGAVSAAWFNPASGEVSDPFELELSEAGLARVHLGQPEGNCDRVLMLGGDKDMLRVPSLSYGEEAGQGEVHKVFEW